MLITYLSDLQIDNQIFGTLRPVLLYATPKSRKDLDADRKPALQISAHKVPSGKWNADIYKVTAAWYSVRTVTRLLSMVHIFLS